MKDLFLGIDIGTSACKAAVFDQAGRVRAEASRSYAVHQPQPGWAQQDPEDWWQAAAAAVSELWQLGITPADIAGVAVDGQSWAAVAVDAQGCSLCPTPIWYDTRSQAQCDELKARIGEQRIFALCGNPVQPGYQLPKILWYKQNWPGVLERTSKILSSNGYLTLKLTGQCTQDLAQGYGMFCFDMARGAWDTAMATEIGIDPDWLCEPLACHQIVGAVTAEAAAATGLLAGTPVVAGGLDCACGTLGAGVAAEGQTQEQGGTAGGMSVCQSSSRAHPALILSFHVTGSSWLLQGGTVGGGGVLRWLEGQLCAQERVAAAQRGVGVFDIINEECAAVPAGCEGLTFLPYMAGERSPIWDPQAKGVYFGLDYTKTRAHLLRAGMEGVAFSLRHNLDTAAQAGARVTGLTAMGGAANSVLWTQIKADVTGLPIDVPSSDTATTLGAALLAAVGVGAYESFEQAVGQTVRVTRTHQPDPERFELYSRQYETYRELYEQLKGTMRRNGQ